MVLKKALPLILLVTYISLSNCSNLRHVKRYEEVPGLQEADKNVNADSDNEFMNGEADAPVSDNTADSEPTGVLGVVGETGSNSTSDADTTVPIDGSNMSNDETGTNSDIGTAKDSNPDDSHEISSEEHYDCFNDIYLEESCAIPSLLEGVMFSDIYSLIFSDKVVEDLYTYCHSGEWCLNSDPVLWYTLVAERAKEFANVNVSAAVCDGATLDCLRKIVANYNHCGQYRRMDLVVKATELLCQLESDGIRIQNCDIHVISALHVNMADIERIESAFDSEDEESDDTDECSTAEALMAGTYWCVQGSCQGYLDVIKNFDEWQWFMEDIDMYTQVCDFADTVICANITVVTEPPSMWMGDANNTSTESFEDVIEEIEEMIEEEEEENAELTPKGSSENENEEFSNDDRFEPENENQNTAQESNQQLMTGEEATRKKASGVWVYQSDMRVMIGVAVATVMTVCGLTVLGVLCWRKRLRERSLKSGYEQLLSDENYEN